jgi:hypothetical protein
MNCTIVEKLLPLYVEGDASEREAVAVRAHLSDCPNCRAVETEFRASQARLHNFAVPEFGAEFYEQLRGSVLKEINNSGTLARPSFFERLRASLQWRPVMAFSLALLILAGALSLTVLYRSLLRSNAPLLAIDKSMGDFSPLPEAEAGRTGDEANSGNAGARNPGSTARNTVRQRNARGGQPIMRPESSTSQSINTASSDVAEARQKTAVASEKNVAPPTQAMARMDIQTSDPNIRIIWLARKTGE